MNSLREYVQSQQATTVAKSLGFWLIFGLLFLGLQLVPLPFVGASAAAVAGCVAIAVLLLLAFSLLRTDGKTFRDVGIRRNSDVPGHFLVGVGLGFVVVGIMIAIVLALTPVTIQTTPDSNVLAVLLASFLVFFILALMEEIAFRSYPLFRLKEAWGIRPAVYITSVAFAFYHGFAFENLLGPGVWGLYYAWMAFSTKSIALPTGFHLGLNWVQALIGMKPQYSDSIWVLSIGTGSGLFDVEVVGVVLQLVLLAIGVFLVENFIAKQQTSNLR